MDKIKRIKELITQLNTYRNAYYNNSESQISDYEYDNLFDELKKLEDETGVIMSNSPTQTVGYEVKSKLEKVKHSHPMLSLDKTKSVDDLRTFAGSNDCVLSLKMDGLTVLLTYENGELIQAETRGNGEEGELITHNAKVFENIPLQIKYTGRLEIEGEAIITYPDFENINSKLSEDEKYKNPRNLVSGSVRQLDSNVAAKRHIKFIAWKVPFIENLDEIHGGSLLFRLIFVKELGFDVVPLLTYASNTSDYEDLEKMVDSLKNRAETSGFPIDGLVMAMNDIEYGESLGMTGHHPKHSIAFKFYDEEVTTTLRDIEWSMGKTGSLCPVAIFDSVEIDGTEVSRASVHNWSMVQDLELGIGDTITVYKANMIIPQIADNLTRSGTATFPDECPICGGLTKIVKDNDTKVVVCDNPNCKGKLLGKLTHSVSKNALNIDGMSEATIEFLIERGWLSSIKNIYRLDYYREPWKEYDGFGDKSVDRLLDNIETSRKTTMARLLYSLSVPLIGKSASKDITNHCQNDIETFVGLMNEDYDFTVIDGFGTEMQKSLSSWWSDNRNEFMELLKEFEFESTYEVVTDKKLEGLTFVITGSLINFGNRTELQNLIESKGGKVSGSVSAKTSYLINNDKQSSSSKNQKAQKLNIPIISEEDFIKMIGE